MSSTETPVVEGTQQTNNTTKNGKKPAKKAKPSRNGFNTMSSAKAIAEVVKTGKRVATQPIFVMPIADIKDSINPRNEPEHLYRLGYVLIGDPKVDVPDPKNGKYVSLLHMALSDNLQKYDTFAKLMREHEIVDRERQPNAPQSICELADDMKTYGQLMPIKITKDNIARDGNRRLAAALLLHAESKAKIAKKEEDAPSKPYPAVIEATNLDCKDEDELFRVSCKINLSRKNFTELQEGRIYHEMLKRINPDTVRSKLPSGKPNPLYDRKHPKGRPYNKKEAATVLGVHPSTFRNREALWHNFNPRTGKGLTDEERAAVASGKMLVTFASRKSLGEKHYSESGQRRNTRAKPVPLSKMQDLFDNTAPSNVERRKAIAECMGINDYQRAVKESEARIKDKELAEAGGRRRKKNGKAA